MIKANGKPNHAQGNTGVVLPAVSFEISKESGSKEQIPPSQPNPPSDPLTLPLSQNNRRPQIALAFETSGDRSGTQTPMSIPDSPKRRSKSTGRKRCSSLSSHSRNSSVHSLLTECVNSEASLSAPEKGERKYHPKNVKQLRLMTKKRQEILHVQKMLTHQQNLYITLYAQLKELEARSGIDAGDCLGTMRILTMKGWPAHDLLMLVQDDAAGQVSTVKTDINGVLGPAVLEELRSEFASIPREVSEMGNDLMLRRLKMLGYFRKRISEVKVKNEFDVESETVQKLVLDTIKLLEAKLNHSLDIARTSWKDRDVLITKIDRLNKEISILQSKLAEVESLPKKIEPTDKPDESTTDLKEKLSKERAARESLKHMVATAESLLRSARGRITVLERELKATQKQLQTSTRKQKEYELLNRCRETSYGVRSKKLLEESKTGEETIEMLTLQRDALELRVKELQEQVKSIIEDYEGRQSKHQSSLDRLQDKVDEKEKQRVVAETRVAELEKRIQEIQDEYRRLISQSDQLAKMSSDKCLDYLPRKENEPTLTEAELWKDLNATQMKLEQVTAELRQSREDKESLLNSLAKIAQEGSENNMANELLLREQKNFRLQQRVEELKLNVKSMSESIAQKDRQIVSLKMEASRINYESCSKETPEQDLQLQVLDLSTQVASLTRERESLVTAAMSRALMLERHERCAEMFAHITRTRREIVAQLEGKDRPHSDSAFVDTNLVSSLSPACLKAAETWSELRSDRERLLQLQDMVASQNMQLSRERRVRNQLEQRRAILERLFLNRAAANPEYVPAENVANILGTSSYLADDGYVHPS